MTWSDPATSSRPRLPNGRMTTARERGRMIVEMVCWIAGLALLATYFLATAGLESQRKQGIELFTQARASATVSHGLENLALPGQTAIVPSGQESAPATPGDPEADPLPVAVLRIADLGVEVPVYPDLTEMNLSRGAGWIGGTAAPNTGGNMAIAAHRDRYFRPLKDIQLGDTIELESLSGRVEYRVERITIVDPDDVSVLDDTKVSTLTLVTCYPFYFIGNAPQRYIVQAVAVDQPENASKPYAVLTASPSGVTP